MYWSITNWCGYLYVTSTFLGSKAVNSIAACNSWLLATGEKSILEGSENLKQATISLADKISQIQPLKIVGKPRYGTLRIESTDSKLDMVVLAQCLKDQEWILEPTMDGKALLLILHKHNLQNQKDLLSSLRKAIKEAEGVKDSSSLKREWLLTSRMVELNKSDNRASIDAALAYLHAQNTF